MTLADDLLLQPTPPGRIVSRRATRFMGQCGLCNLVDLSAGTTVALTEIYRWLEAIAALGAPGTGLHMPPSSSPSPAAGIVRADAATRGRLGYLLGEPRLKEIIARAHEMQPPAGNDRCVERLIGDFRGDALQQVVGLAGLWRDDPTNDELTEAIGVIARDHAKVLRQTVVGLDEVRRQIELATRMHGIENLRRRLPLLILFGPGGPVRVDFSSGWTGDFALTCPEFSTVLRQLYRLMENAARHSADRLVRVRVDAVPADAPVSVRFSVGNQLPADAGEPEPAELVWTVWSGHAGRGARVGLGETAALVAEAFGLDSADEAIALGYVGSRQSGAGYVTWMYWPVVEAQPG